MYLLKQALPLITALQLSLSTSHGPAASTEEPKSANRTSLARMLKFGCWYEQLENLVSFGLSLCCGERLVLTLGVSSAI